MLFKLHFDHYDDDATMAYRSVPHAFLLCVFLSIGLIGHAFLVPMRRRLCGVTFCTILTNTVCATRSSVLLMIWVALFN